MDNDANNSDSIEWVTRKTWGTIGRTHITQVVIGDDTHKFIIDQPGKGYWVARGWTNGTANTLYREGYTLAEMKQVVALAIGGMRSAAKAAGR